MLLELASPMFFLVVRAPEMHTTLPLVMHAYKHVGIKLIIFRSKGMVYLLMPLCSYHSTEDVPDLDKEGSIVDECQIFIDL